MEKTIFLKSALVVLFLAGPLFASSCAKDAYAQACASCSFDASGKMDPACYKEKQSAGIACLTASNPFLAKAYAEGKCPQVDQCTARLNECKAKYSSGNDTADCRGESVALCFDIADGCVASASAKCAPPPECKAPAALIMLVGGAVFLAGFAMKE